MKEFFSLDECNSIDDVISYMSQFGKDEDRIAGAYAYNGIEFDVEFCSAEDQAMAQLEALADAGAEFDQAEALEYAIQKINNRRSQND